MNSRWILVGTRIILAISVILSGLALVNIPIARAATFNVNSTADAVDANPGDTLCQTATPGECTLRAAIEESNANGEADVIRLGTGTYTLTAGTLPITTQIEVVPNQATDQVTIVSNGPTLFTVNAGGDLTLTRLTLTGATAGPAVDVNAGTLNITTSTLTNNASGAIRVNGVAAASVTESTISGNAGGDAAGVDVAVAGATVVLTRLTIVDNTGGAVAGGVRAIAGSNVSLAGSIVANNTGTIGADCDGTLVATGVNLVETPGAGCTVGGTVLNLEPNLAALAANGGTTQTRLPALTSPAVDAGGACGPATDQRGVTRARGAGCELGAVELPVVTFVSTAVGATDSNTTATLSANLDAALPFDLNVGITLGGGTAVAGTDYNATVLPFTFTAGATADTTDVTILRNTAITGNRTFNATVTSGAVPGNGAVTITITDFEGVVVSWDQVTYTVSEAAGTLTVRANLSLTAVEAVTVTFSTADGGARAGTEYVGITGGTIVIPQGQTFGTSTITITNNGWYGLSKNFLVQFTASSVGARGPDTIVTITEDDAPPAVAFGAANYNVIEGVDANAVLTVGMLYTSEVAISVPYTIAPGTAVEGADYTGTGGTAIIAGDSLSATITVPLVNNNYYSASQSFTVNLTSQAPGSLGTPASATVTITDPADLQTVSLGAPAPLSEASPSVAIAASIPYTSEVPIDVSYTTVNGTAVSGSDFVGGPGLVTIPISTTSATISISLINNNYYSGQQQFTVQLVSQSPGGANAASTTVLINDDEGQPVVNFTAASFSGAENGGPIVLNLSINPPAEAGFTVPFTVVNGTDAVSGVDFSASGSPVPITSLATSASISVAPNDNAYHSDNRTFGVVLQAPSLGTVGTTNPSTTVVLTDNEGIPSASIVDPSGTGYSVGELAGNATITVTLSHTSTAAINVNYLTQNGSATSGTDFQGTTGSSIQIAARQVSATLSIPIFNNNVFTGDESFAVQINGQTPGAIGSPSSTQVTIIDAQQPPTIQFSASGYNVPRDIGTTAITVTLSAPTGIAVTINYTVTAGTAQPGVDYVLSNGVVTFAPGDLTETIPVEILNSGLYVGDRAFNLGLSAPTAGSLLGDTPLTTVLIRETNARRIHLPQVRKYYNAFVEYEPNATRTTANGPLTSGLTYTGQFNADQVDRYGLDQDTWRFQVANPGPVTVTVIGNDPGRQIKVINAGGADVPGGFSGDPAPTVTYTFNVTASGTYYVRVYNSSQLGVATYQIRVVHP